MRLVNPSPWQQKFSFRQLLGRLGSCRALVGRKLLPHPGVEAYAASEKHWPILHSLGDSQRNVQTLAVRHRSWRLFANSEALMCTHNSDFLSVQTQQTQYTKYNGMVFLIDSIIKLLLAFIAFSLYNLNYWVIFRRNVAMLLLIANLRLVSLLWNFSSGLCNIIRIILTSLSSLV